MADAAPMSRREIQEKIVALAWKDEAFRRSFVADPKAAFERKLKTKLPPDLKITAHEEDDNHLYFVIPANPKVNVGELSDEDLEKIAGGVDAVTTVVISIGVIAAAAGSAIGSVVVAAETRWDGKVI
jgi:hypothetical protein